MARCTWRRPSRFAGVCTADRYSECQRRRHDVGTKSGTAALRPEDGRLAWRSRIGASRTVYGDKVYLRGVNQEAEGWPSRIVVLDARTGRECWHRDYPEISKKTRDNRLTSRVRPPVPLDVTILGTNAGEEGRGRGSWTFSKWTGEGDGPELDVNWSLAEMRGRVVEKDQAQREAFVRLFADLASR
jgi:hypothetical protein